MSKAEQRVPALDMGVLETVERKQSFTQKMSKKIKVGNLPRQGGWAVPTGGKRPFKRRRGAGARLTTGAGRESWPDPCRSAAAWPGLARPHSVHPKHPRPHPRHRST